jgi:hypothetical protein
MIEAWIETLKKGSLISEKDVKKLCMMAKCILMEESNVQNVATPVTVCLS